MLLRRWCHWDFLLFNLLFKFLALQDRKIQLTISTTEEKVMAVLLKAPDWGGGPTGVADLTGPAELKGIQLEGGENGVSCLMVVLLSGKDDRRHFSKPK